jgi:hypothetical protein
MPDQIRPVVTLRDSVLGYSKRWIRGKMMIAFWINADVLLVLHSLDNVTTVRRLVEFYVQEHNRMLPHSAFRGQTPYEDVLRHRGRRSGRSDVTRGRRTPGRVEANRSAACGRAHQSTRPA